VNPRSLVFRLGAWYTLLLSAIFILVGAGTFFALQHYLRSSLRDSLSRRSLQVEQILLEEPAQSTAGLVARDIETRIAPEFNNRFVRVTSSSGDTVYRSGPPADRSFDPTAIDAAPFDSSRKVPTETRTLLERHLMIRTGTVRAAAGTYQIEVGASTAGMEDVLNRLLDLLAVLLPILIVCAAMGGYWLVVWALRPVDRLSQTAEQMSLQNPTLRLPVSPSGDALERLSVSLNNMLGRLLDSVQSSRRFLADASHELRTPLTVIKGELQELTHEVNLGQGELGERVGSVLEEVGRLEHLVAGLLALSRLDAGEMQGAWAEVDLAELSLSTAEQMRLMAEDKNIRIETSSLVTAVILGDKPRLKQIIVNLLDNAIRFTGRGGTVALQTRTTEEGSLLEISDTGIGIPQAAVEHIFDRFYRVDPSRSREDGGAGLGLSIVKSICLAHGAEIQVESLPSNGSTFRIWFPRRSMVPTNPPTDAVPQPAPKPSPGDPTTADIGKKALHRTTLGPVQCRFESPAHDVLDQICFAEALAHVSFRTHTEIGQYAPCQRVSSELQRVHPLHAESIQREP
jgi:heavy metal sensor kinase